uniref:Uncharacterized protein n=1 Tax=Arundo donax TaxID=35708 RepID=A0A0A9DXX4_ARUDO
MISPMIGKIMHRMYQRAIGTPEFSNSPNKCQIIRELPKIGVIAQMKMTHISLGCKVYVKDGFK